MRERFPEVQPHASGMLDVGDGQAVHWEVSGNPEGLPAVLLHGGPGQGSRPGHRRLFDPARWRIVQFDQRGCGRSTPHAADPGTDLRANTTQALIADMEGLREHLGIQRWAIWGGSWGVTLGVAYAERHPERVIAMLLASITLTRPADVDWFAHGARRFFPREWERFRDAVPEPMRGDLLAAYDHLLNEQPDVTVRERASRDWAAWEDALLSLEEGAVVPNPMWDDDRFRLAFTRLTARYFHHAAFLEPDELIANAGRLAGVPGVLLHGRLDISGPPLMAHELAAAWPGAELHYVNAGHRGDTEMTRLLLETTDRFAAL